MSNYTKKQKWIQISYFLYIVFLLFSIYNDLHFFDFTSEERTHFYITYGNPNSLLFYVTVKIAFAILCYWVRGKIVDIAYAILVEKDQKIKELCMFCLSLFVVYCIIIILVYPGIWWANDADEFTLFSFNRRLQVQYHQGFMSSLMFLFGLMFYPKPVVVVLFQAVIGACVLGNIIWSEWERVHNKRTTVLLFLVSISPACLYFVAYPVRAWLFSVFFLAFLYKLYRISLEGTFEKKDLVELTIWLILVVNYRTEVKFMILLYPIILYFILKGSYKKYILIAESILIVSVLIVSAWNQLGNQATKKTHSSLFMVGPLGVTLNDEAFDSDTYAKELQAIEKVLDLHLVKMSNGSDTQGPKDESGYTEEEFQAYIKNIVKITLLNPKTYLKNKVGNMLDSVGLTEYTKMGYDFPEEIEPENIRPYFNRWNSGLQEKVAALLAGQVEIAGVKLYYAIFAFWIPILGMISLFLSDLKKRVKGMGSIFVIYLCQFAVVMLFAPVHFQMYYFPFYLAGWFFIILSRGRKYSIQG